MKNIKSKLYRIIFNVDTFWSKAFDVFLLILIFLSVILVALESVPKIEQQYGDLLFIAEWIVTILFTIEYILRIIVSHHTYKYVKSFWGIIDLLSILPLYIAIFISGAQVLSVIRSLRLIRIFRVLNLSSFENESKILGKAIKDSFKKIQIFLYTIIVLVVIIGTLMYYIEGAENGFVSIPKSIYWAIVTLTTVGYGDISPHTGLGQFLASSIMIIGYAIIAVPTGIVSAEMTKAKSENKKQIICKNCNSILEDEDAVFCKYCGKKIQIK